MNDYEHRDALTILGWQPVEWRCKECRSAADHIYEIAHAPSCTVSAREVAELDS